MSQTTDIQKLIKKANGISLPDNAQWTNRFEIKSETRNFVYVIAQHKNRKHWGCSCPGWRGHRVCKHLKTIGLPCFEKPYEPDKLG